MAFDAFISYKHVESSSFARQLERDLRVYGKAFFQRPRLIFRDENYLTPGGELPDLIRKHLESSRYLILLASKKAADSRWVQEEISQWCGPLNRADKVIIVLTKDDIIVANERIDWERTTALPRTLQSYITMPYYVDARGFSSEAHLTLEHVGFKWLVNAIVARLVGLTPDQMNNEALRQHRRYLVFRNLALIFLILAVAFAINRQMLADQETKFRARLQYAADIANVADALNGEVQKKQAKSQLLALKQQHEHSKTSYLQGFEWRLLWRLVQPDLAYIGNDYRTVTRSVVFSPKDPNILFSSEGSKVVIHDLASASISVFDATLSAWSLALSPDGAMLAAGETECGVSLWDVPTRRKIAYLLEPCAPAKRPLRYVWSVAFSPSGQMLATGHWDGEARVWNVSTRALVARLRDKGNVRAVAFSPDGKLLATGGDGCVVKLYDAVTCEPRGELPQPGNGIYSLAFSPTGSHLASGHRDGSVIIWDHEAKQEVAKVTAASSVYALAYSPDGALLAAGSFMGDTTIWSVPKTNVVARLWGHANIVWSLAFSRDGGRLAIGNSGPHAISLWKANTPQVYTLAQNEPSISRLAFSTKGLLLASGHVDGTIKVWNPNGTTMPVAFSVEVAPPGMVLKSLTFTRDDKSLVAVFDPFVSSVGKHIVRRVNLASKKVDTIWEGPAMEVGGAPDGETVGVYSYDDSFSRIRAGQVWGKTMHLPEFGKMIPRLALSSTGRFLAINDNEIDGATLAVWDCERGGESFRRESPSSDHLAFSPAEDVLAVMNGWEINLWEVPSGRRIARLRDSDTTFASVAFSPDGQVLATGREAGGVTLWDVRTGLKFFTFGKEDMVDVDAVAFSPNNSMIAAGGKAGTIKLWYAGVQQKAPSACQSRADSRPKAR